MKAHKIIIPLAGLLAIITIGFLGTIVTDSLTPEHEIRIEAHAILSESGHAFTKDASVFYNDSIIVSVKRSADYPHWVDTFYILNRRNKDIIVIDNAESFYKYIYDSLHIENKFELLCD